MKPYAEILRTSSAVKMVKKTHSLFARKSALGVQHKSRGDSHAIVAQLARIVSRITGSNRRDSTNKIHRERGKWPGCSMQQPNDVLA